MSRHTRSYQRGVLPWEHTESERESVCSLESIVELLPSVADGMKQKGHVKEEAVE